MPYRINTEPPISMDSDQSLMDEKIFELAQEHVRLRGQITYLQEEVAALEDQVSQLTGDLIAANEAIDSKLAINKG